MSRLRQSTRVRDQAQLCSAIAAHLFTDNEYSTAFTFYTFDEQLSTEAGMEAVDVLIPIRRQGECLCELGEYEDAVKQLQRCEAVLQSLDGRTNGKKRHRLQQEVLICRGTAWLNWSDDAQTPANESRKRVLKAQQCYQKALSLAQQLCAVGKKGKRSKSDAEMLAGSYENLGTAVVQLLYFDNVELDNRHRQQTTANLHIHPIIDVTDSGSQPISSVASPSPYDPLTSPPYSLDALPTDTLIAHKQARFECASGLFDEAIAIAEECGLLEYSVRSLHNLGTLYEKMEKWDEAISFLNTAILRIQDAAPRAVRMADRVRHEVSTRSVLVHMCTRAGRYELAVEEAMKAVRRAKELDSGLEDARNDLKLAEDVAARVVAISTVEEHVAEREEAVRLEERRTSSLSAIDTASADKLDSGLKRELVAEVSVSLEAVVAAIPVLLSAVRELHKLSDLHVANAHIGVRSMESFERALQAAEKAIDMQQVEVNNFQTAIRQQQMTDSEKKVESSGSDDSIFRLSPPQRFAYNSLLDSLSRSYAHYGNTRLSFFRQTTMDKSDSSQLRRSRQLTLRAFEQAAHTATTPLLRTYMMSRLAEVQFNSAVEHSGVMGTLRQALTEAERDGLVLLSERILQQMSSAIDEEEEAEVVKQRHTVEGEERQEETVEKQRTAAERAEMMLQLRAVQRRKEEPRNTLGSELSAIRELDDEFELSVEEIGQRASQEENEEGWEEAEVESEADVMAPSSRRSSRRQAAAVRQRPSVARKAREVLQAGRKAASVHSSDGAAREKASVILLSDDDDDDVMDEDDDDDESYDPTFVDTHSFAEVNTAHLTHSVPSVSPVRSSSAARVPPNRSARNLRSHRRLTPPSSPFPPPAATHYDTDDSDAEDDQLGKRTAQAISTMYDREERKEENRTEGARLLRTANILQSRPSTSHHIHKPRKRRRRASYSEDEARLDDADFNFIVEDRKEDGDGKSEREKRSSTSRPPPLFSAVPSRRSMREMNASGQPWRAVCAQLLAERERSRADERLLTQPQLRGVGSAGSYQSSDGSRDSRDRAGSSGSRSSQQRAVAATQPRLAGNRVERELVMLDADTETVTTRTETQYVDDTYNHFEQSPPRSQPQSQSLPLAARPSNGPPHTTYSDPVVAYRPLRSISLPRHSVRYQVEDLTDVMPLVAGADDRSHSLTDEELGTISMLTLADELVQHIQRRTGRICVIGSISHRGQLLGADHTAEHIFQRHQQSGSRIDELPLLSIVLDHWKPITMLDCYRTLCQTCSRLRIHPLVMQQLHLAATIHFPRRLPPTLDSVALQPLFDALRVEPGTLTSLSLPPLPLQADAVAAFARSICYSQAAFLPVHTRLAYCDLFPHTVFPLPPTCLGQEPLPPSLAQLSYISLSGVKASSVHLNELVGSFALLPALCLLDLSDTPLTDECLPGLCFLVQTSDSLSRLNLSRSLFTADSPKDRSRLTAAFSASKCLTDLDMSHGNLSLESTTALLPALQRLHRINLSSLRCLQPHSSQSSSSSASDSPAGLSLFYSSLSRHLRSPQCCLTTVVLHDVADVSGLLSGVVCLALAAPSCRLLCFELCNNGLSLQAVLRLLAVLRRRNRSIRRLVLDGNRAVSDEAAYEQLCQWITEGQASAQGRGMEWNERVQVMQVSAVVGLDENQPSCALNELSVRQCGLSTVAQQKLLTDVRHTTCAQLTVHV